MRIVLLEISGGIRNVSQSVIRRGPSTVATLWCGGNKANPGAASTSYAGAITSWRR